MKEKAPNGVDGLSTGSDIKHLLLMVIVFKLVKCAIETVLSTLHLHLIVE